MHLRRLPIALITLAPLPAAAQGCLARAGARPPLVLELYTSEGCSSCPPADRWLSSLKVGTELLPLSFHVNYGNPLGWPDRFASTEATQRRCAGDGRSECSAGPLARLLGGAGGWPPQPGDRRQEQRPDAGTRPCRAAVQASAGMGRLGTAFRAAAADAWHRPGTAAEERNRSEPPRGESHVH